MKRRQWYISSGMMNINRVKPTDSKQAAEPSGREISCRNELCILHPLSNVKFTDPRPFGRSRAEPPTSSFQRSPRSGVLGIGALEHWVLGKTQPPSYPRMWQLWDYSKHILTNCYIPFHTIHATRIILREAFHILFVKYRILLVLTSSFNTFFFLSKVVQKPTIILFILPLYNNQHLDQKHTILFNLLYCYNKYFSNLNSSEIRDKCTIINNKREMVTIWIKQNFRFFLLTQSL